MQNGGDVRVDQLSMANTLSDTVLSCHHDPGTPIADYERLVTVSVTWAYVRR